MAPKHQKILKSLITGAPAPRYKCKRPIGPRRPAWPRVPLHALALPWTHSRCQASAPAQHQLGCSTVLGPPAPPPPKTCSPSGESATSRDSGLGRYARPAWRTSRQRSQAESWAS
eukprot:TRINITY_DN3526_c1_g2_i1.p2 TRINITY_DN3526_c1_g2~~TRINITY_DN3526_c1_g2_i1.p2  ORF type:complete len:115 (-),score=3.84 TRINITY_DN3526_c1_g2_i1:204-548(-)